MEDLKNEIDNIGGHIRMLIDEDVLEKIGADIGDNRPLHLRILRILDDYNDLQAENKRLKEELNKNAAFVYNQAILATPTGDLRNRLTELNILRLQALKETQ